jgi:hypothetical protein
MTYLRRGFVPRGRPRALKGLGSFGINKHARTKGVGVRDFFDTFVRANTVAPDLGFPTIPDGFSGKSMEWALYGEDLGTAVGGQISSNAFIAAAEQIVYAEQNVGGTVRRVGAVVAFVNGGAGAIGTAGSATLLISADPNFIDNAVHIVTSRTGARVEKIVDGVVSSAIASLSFGSPYLPKDGSKWPLTFEIDANGAFTLFFAGKSVSATDSELGTLAGPLFVAEIYQPDANSESLAQYHQVYALQGGSAQVPHPETELLSIGDMASSDGWTVGSGWSFSAGYAIKSAGSEGSIIPTTPVDLVEGGTYLCTYEMEGYSAGAFLLGMGGANGSVRTANGAYSDEITVTNAAANLTFYGNLDAVGSLAYLSVRQIS